MPVTLASFEAEWGEYQDDISNKGFVSDTVSTFTEVSTVYTVSDGFAYQPLAVNMTGGSNLEVIISSGNYLKMYDPQLNLIDELNLGSAIQSQPTIYNTPNGNAYVLITNQIIHAYTYNGTAFVNQFANSSEINMSGHACDTPMLRCIANSFCYSLGVDGSSIYAYKINITNGSWIESSALSPDAIRGIPAIGDIDRDGRHEIVFSCDADANGDCGICVLDVNTSNGKPYLDTGFSGDGIIDDIDEVGRSGNPVIYNIDEGGDSEIILSFALNGNPTINYIRAYNSDGSTKWTSPNLYFGAVHFSNPIIMEYGNSTKPDVCAVGMPNAAPGSFRVSCVTYTGSLLYSRVYTGGSNGGTISYRGFEIIAASVKDGADPDSGGTFDIISSEYIIQIYGEQQIIYNFESNGTSDTAYHTSYADLNNDGEGEIIITKAGTTKIIYSAFTNGVPTLYNNLSYGGYGNNYGYSTPICINTTVTFSAQECGGDASCNYDNDGSTDTERIVGNCGQNPGGEASTSFTNNIANGTLAVSNPQFACYYNVTGIFNVRHYLQDDSNLNDFSQYNTETIVINVINGEPGVTCSISEPVGPGETDEEDVTAQEDQTNQAIEDTFGILFGQGSQSDALKLVVGLAIVIGIVAGAAQNGIKNGQTLLGIGLIAIVMVTFIGLLTPAILLLIIMALILLMFFSKFITGGVSSGGGE